MANKGEMRAKLIAEGEQQFRKAMSDAADAIKELNSEQKLAKAQFEATGDAEQYAAEKTRILKEKIEQQKRAVAEAEKAIEKMKSGGIDPNSKAMQDWRTKLNNAKTSLTRMQTQLDKTETELSEQGDALDAASVDAGEYSDAMEQAAKAVDFSAAITAIDNIRNRIGTIIEAAWNAGKAMWNLERGAAGWADELATNATVAGLDVEEYQGWIYASEMIDSSVDSIRGAYKRLNKNLDEPTDAILKSLNELSVANLDISGTARDTMDVFWDVIDAMGRIENTSRRDQLAMELFGKSYDDLLPLIKAGSAAYKEFIEVGKEKAVSAENIDKLTALDDKIRDLDASFNQTKYTVLAELAPAFEKAATAATEAIGAFNDFINTEEGQESLQSMRDAISGVAEDIGKTDWKKVMGSASKVIEKITDGLKWLADNSEVVIGAVTGLGAAWAGLTVSKDVLSVMQLLNTIKWAQITKAAASGANAAAAGGGVGGAAKGAAAAGGGLLKSAAKIAGSAAKNAAGPLAGIAIGAEISKKLDQNYTERVWGQYNDIIDNMPELMQFREDAKGKLYQEMLEAFAGAMDEFENNDDPFGDATIPFKDAFKKYAAELYEIAPDLEIWDWGKYFGDLSDGLDQMEIDSIVNNAMNADSWITMGREAVQKLAEGLEDAQAADAADKMAADVEKAAGNVDAETMGYNVGVGFARGIDQSAAWPIRAAANMAIRTANEIRAQFAIRSPSRVMMAMGEYVSEGFALGIEENISKVERATSRMAAATLGRVTRPEQQTPNAAGGTVHVTLVLDGHVIGDAITPYVDSTIGAQVSRRR